MGILLISSRFFQQYFLAQFNKCQTSKELRDVLTNLKHKLGAAARADKKFSNIEQFEENVMRLAYHSCIARIAFANNNNINDGHVDCDSMLQLFNECKSLYLQNTETYSL